MSDESRDEALDLSAWNGPYVLTELSRVNSELVTRLRQLARQRAAGEDVAARDEDDEIATRLRRHLEQLMSAVRLAEADAQAEAQAETQAETQAGLPQQSRRPAPDDGSAVRRTLRHLAVVPPAEE